MTTGHEACTEVFCRNPLHPGPCRGQHGRSTPLPSSPGRQRARGGTGNRAGATPRARQARSPESTAAAAAATIARATGMVDDPDAFQADLERRLRAARGQGDAAYRQVFTDAAHQLTRGLVNAYAPRLTPEARRTLASRFAPAVAEALRTGNHSQLQGMARAILRQQGLRTASTVAAEEFAMAEDAVSTGTGSWKGLLAPIGKPTGDGRMFGPGSLTNRELPLPLRFQRSDGQGHGGSIVVGRILKIEYTDDGVHGEGDWLDEDITPEVREAKEWSRQKVIGPSVDLDDAVLERVPVDATAAGEEAAAAADCGCDQAHAVAELADQPMITLVTQGRVSGATLVQIPAFAECAALELSDDTPALAASGYTAGDPVAVLDDDGVDHGYYVTTVDGWVTLVRDNGTVDTVEASRISRPEPDEAQAWDDALLDGEADTLVASGPFTPPQDWFADPGLDEPTPLTITPQGRVYGHLAQWGSCHIGLPGCVTPPRSHASYAYFHTGEVQTDAGPVDVGKITLGTGHADPNAGFRAAADHYDHTGACVAIVRAGEDDHGVWVAGALTAGCDDDKAAELRRSPLSGDWRRIGSGLELVAALAVNVPGFPVPRTRVASGRPLSLVAAGSLSPQAREKAAEKGAAMPDGSFPIRDVDELRKAIEAHGRASNVQAARRHIKKRAKALGHEELIPEGWSMDPHPEAVFRRLMKQRDDYTAANAFFTDAERQLAVDRYETAAALLTVIDDEEYGLRKWTEKLHPRGRGGKFTDSPGGGRFGPTDEQTSRRRGLTVDPLGLTVDPLDEEDRPLTPEQAAFLRRREKYSKAVDRAAVIDDDDLLAAIVNAADAGDEDVEVVYRREQEARKRRGRTAGPDVGSWDDQRLQQEMRDLERELREAERYGEEGSDTSVDVLDERLARLQREWRRRGGRI